MNLIQFDDPSEYTPNLLVVPEQWSKESFDNLDFSGREKLKKLLVGFLKNFDYEGCDSLFLHSSDFSYRLLISIYREIGSRITVDFYKFLNWPEYVAHLKGLGFRSDQQFMDDLFSIRFYFIFDLVLSTKEEISYFVKALDYCYIHKINMFICTRTDGAKMVDYIPETMIRIYHDKIVRIGINEIK